MPKLTFAERKAAAKEAIEKLHGTIAQDIQTGADWMEYLRFVSSFRGYSIRNTMLLAHQWDERRAIRAVCRAIETGFFGAPVSPSLPPLGPCAGGKAWIERGGQINKGEKGMGVLVPKIIRDKNDLDADGNPREICIGWFLVNRTFTFPQISGIDVPAEPVTKLAGEGPEGLWDRLVALAASQGYTVGLEDIDGTVNGYCHYVEKRIAVKASNDPAQQVKTLAHEIGHMLLHAEAPALMPTVIQEVEAESVAFTVLDAFGVDSSDYSVGYVGSWARGNGKLIATTVERVVMTATRILEFIETGTLPPAKATTKFDFPEFMGAADAGLAA